MKLSKAQEHVVAEMKAGQVLVRSFDVWGGWWWWWLKPTANRVNTRTAERLLSVGAIVAGKEEQIHSGYREMVCTLREISN